MEIVELVLKEENKGEGITAIALVKHPAIEQSFVAFSKAGKELRLENQYEFKTIDEEQQVVVGPAMIPDKLIYRKDDKGAESFVFFSAKTVRELSERFLYQGKQNNMTLEHDMTLNDLSVIESWIVEDPKRDKSQVYGFDLPVGSWFVKIKVLNDDVWSLVKEKQVTGFSVEGVFARELIKSKTKMKQSKLDGYLDRIKALFADESSDDEQTFGSVEATNADGQEAVIQFPGETLEEGAAVTTEVDGEQVPLPTGRWALAGGGFLIVSEEGVAGAIETEEAPASEEESEEEMNQIEKLTEQQMEALIDGIANVLSQFKSDMQKHVDTSVKEATDKLREEFNKPAAKPKPEVPGSSEQKKISKGLAAFVREAEAEKK